MSNLTLKINCFHVFSNAKKCCLLLRFNHVCVKFTLRTVQVLKDETEVKVNNTEWHERAHCPYNFPLICAVCTCDKMIHQIGSHNDKHHRSSLWLLMEQFCSHPVKTALCVYILCVSCRATVKSGLSFSATQPSDSALWDIVVESGRGATPNTVSVVCQRKVAVTAKRSVHRTCSTCACRY